MLSKSVGLSESTEKRAIEDLRLGLAAVRALRMAEDVFKQGKADLVTMNRPL